MKDLTGAELMELAGNCQTVIDDMAFIGMSAVLVFTGRGINRVAYSAHDAKMVPIILQTALDSANAYNAKNLQ